MGNRQNSRLYTDEEKEFLRRLGQEVKSSRKKAKMTQMEGSVAAPVNYRYLQKIESEDTPAITIIILKRLADTYGIRLSRLIKKIEDAEQ